MQKLKILSVTLFLITIIAIGSLMYVFFPTSFDLEIKNVSTPSSINKSDPLIIELEVAHSNFRKLQIEGVEVNLTSSTYSFTDIFIIPDKISISKSDSTLISLALGPLLHSTSNKYYALNLGNFTLNSISIISKRPVMAFYKELSASFEVKEYIGNERLLNGKFESNFENWEIHPISPKVSTELVFSDNLQSNSIAFSIQESITPIDEVTIYLSQNIDISNTHHISFDAYIDALQTDQIDISLSQPVNSYNMSITLGKGLNKNNILFYGTSSDAHNITIKINFRYVDAGAIIYLTNFSIKQVYNPVFIAVFNQNWEYRLDNIERDSPIIAIQNASKYFEEQFSIYFKPLVELPWVIEPIVDKSLIYIRDSGKEFASRELGLKHEWDTNNGRSIHNNGFDMLAFFSNQTAPHFGFASRTNMAFHFAKSKHLQDQLSDAGLGFLSIRITKQTAINLIQHEISHLFNAEDRDRKFYPSSIMTKTSTAEDTRTDLINRELWLLVHNWLIQDILLILAVRDQFN